MSAKSEPYLAYERVPVGAHGETKVELQTAIEPDIYSEIDERNGWKDSDSPTHDECADEIEFSAKGFRTMLQFVWDGVVLSDDVAGLRTAVRRFVAIAHRVCPDALRGGKVVVKTSP